MTKEEILVHVDHTLLKAVSAWDEIQTLCEEAIENHTASVCIPPSYVKQAAEYMAGKMTVCTVIGFPNGYMTTAAKEFETKDALANGASEIDMVINIGWLKDKKYDLIEKEIRTLKEACADKILKVIIETCYLTEDEKRELCKCVTDGGADYIKTSTGFAGGGATREDVALMAAHMTNGKKIKAAGGIASLQDAEDFLKLGADRLGTSRIVKAVKELEAKGQF